MNKNQLIAMWCGIVAIVLFGFVMMDSYRPEYGRFAVCVLITALITGGLILTFRDKKRPEGETGKPVNLRRGFKRITFLLSILVGLFAGLSPIVPTFEAYDFVRGHERQLEFYENAVKTGEYNKSQLDVVQQARRLEIAKNNFWYKLSVAQVVVLCMMVGVAGFCGVWLVYFIVRLIHRLIKWFAVGFRIDTG